MKEFTRIIANVLMSFVLTLFCCGHIWSQVCTTTPPSTTFYLKANNSLNGGEGEIPLSSVSVGFVSGVCGQGLSLPTGSRLSYSSSGNVNSTEGTFMAWVIPGWNGNDNTTRGIFSWGGNGGMLIGKDGANNFRVILNKSNNESGLGYNISGWSANTP